MANSGRLNSRGYCYDNFRKCNSRPPETRYQIPNNCLPQFRPYPAQTNLRNPQIGSNMAQLYSL